MTSVLTHAARQFLLALEQAGSSGISQSGLYRAIPHGTPTFGQVSIALQELLAAGLIWSELKDAKSGSKRFPRLTWYARSAKAWPALG